MDNTYKFLDHTEPLSVEEIKKLYKGYWVYLVKAEFSKNNALLGGIPVIIGAIAYDGAADGIYEKYKAEEYGESTDLNLLPNKGFISSLRVVGA